jgi:hypothetical protein
LLLRRISTDFSTVEEIRVVRGFLQFHRCKQKTQSGSRHCSG